VRTRRRPDIAFFDYADVFEDFYPHYGVDQESFATQWANSGNHAFLAVLQREVGNVVWYEFSLAPQIAGARHEVVGCEVKFLPSSWLHRSLWRLFYLPQAAWRWRRLYPAYAAIASYVASLSWGFLRSLLRDRPDIFFVQDYANGRYDLLVILARAFRARVVAYHAGSRPEKYIGRLLKRWSIPAADCLIVSSCHELEMLASRYGVSRERMKVVLTPIDTTTFKPRDRTEACRAAGLEACRRYLLFVGRLDDKIKRVSDLILVFAELAAKHADIDLLIIGEGEDGAALRGVAAALAPERVRFLGWVQHKHKLADYYSSAECLVLASVSEGFPTVVGEAMACGTPVVGSNVGGIGEMVERGKTGWLLPPGDRLALKAALTEVLSEPDRLVAMRPRARQVAEERVSPVAVAAQLRECFLAKAIG